MSQGIGASAGVILERATRLLGIVAGVDAVVLGGSRALGTAKSTSDVDIGIYYSDASTLDFEALNRAATALDDAHRSNLVTEPGGWGPWINGGG